MAVGLIKNYVDKKLGSQSKTPAIKPAVQPSSSNSTKSNPNTSYQMSSGAGAIKTSTPTTAGAGVIKVGGSSGSSNNGVERKWNEAGTAYTDYKDGKFVGSGVKGTENYQAPKSSGGSGGSSGFKFNYDALSYDDALKRSQAQLDPIYQKAIENIKAQKYQDELNAGQLASARGLSHSGLAADLQNKVALTAQSNISNAEAEKSAKLAEMAQAMLEKDQARSDQLRAQMYQEYMGEQQLGLQRDQFGYQKQRDSVADQQWQSQFDYQKTRDTTADSQWQSQFDYQKSRDTTADSQWQSQFDYQKTRDAQADKQWQSQYEYQKARDAIADQQWRQQFDLQSQESKDQRALAWQQFEESKRQFNSEDSWRKYVYANLSASEQAQLDWAKQQYGEDQAWKMFELEYNGELQKSMAETEAGAYSSTYSDFLG